MTVRPIGLEAAWAPWTDVGRRQDNVFSTWEWAWTWWETYGRDRQALVHEVLDADGRTIGILPLYLAKQRPARVLRFIGHGPADQLGPVCAPADRARVGAALQALVAELAGPRGILLAEGVRGDHGWGPWLRGELVRRQSSPVIRLDGITWEEWLATKSSNFRQQVRRRERRLDNAGRLRFRLVRDEAERASAMRTLVELHRARWGTRSTAFDEHVVPVHERFTQLAAERDWLRLWTADIDGRPAAAWLGYRFGTADAYYQMGRDPSLDDTSIGSVLLMHTIRDAMQAGRGEYRLLRGSEQYKDRLQSEDPGVDTYVVGTGRVPAVVAAVVRHRGRLPGPVRAALARTLTW